ncbi:MAG: Uroporphyrinogen-III synthase [Verrucomicrobiota bacterium]|jgi:uroporphyrinogen-III synthase
MSKLPLRDRMVVLTRPEGRGADWKEALADAGAAVSELPLIAISFEPDDAVLSEVLDGINQYDWVVFTSANGVRGFFDRFFERFTDIRSVGGARFACVGPATERQLRAYHLDSDLTAVQADARALGQELIEKNDIENQKVLLVTGNLNSPELPRILSDGGLAIVDVLKVYGTEENPVGASPEAAEFRRRGADAIVFASPSAVESFIHQAASLRPEAGARQPKAVAVGPTTADAVRRAGIPLAATASAPTAAAVRDAVITALAS